MSSGTERVERVAAILRNAIPGAEVTHQDSGDYGAVVFTITNTVTKGAAKLLISRERFEEDQDETEKLVHQAIAQLAPGDSWLLTTGGTLVAYP